MDMFWFSYSLDIWVCSVQGAAHSAILDFGYGHLVYGLPTQCERAESCGSPPVMATEPSVLQS